MRRTLCATNSVTFLRIFQTKDARRDPRTRPGNRAERIQRDVATESEQQAIFEAELEAWKFGNRMWPSVDILEVKEDLLTYQFSR